MLTLRKDKEIYTADGGWFQAKWHFSFDRYRDPEQMGVGALRVFNDDRIVGGAAWPMHPHRDLESLTYVVDGRFEHADSLGNNGRFERGAAQVMSFSHGAPSIPSATARRPRRCGSFSSGVLPSTISAESSVQQRQYEAADRSDTWLQIMSPPGEPGLDLRQDTRVWVSRLSPGAALARSFDDGRGGYGHVIEGSGTFNGKDVRSGDAAKIHGPETLEVVADTGTELIVVDSPLWYRPVGVWASR